MQAHASHGAGGSGARPEGGRARATSGAFSFRSKNSEDNNTSSSKSPKTKHARKESDSERRKTHYDPSTKANPNAAMIEAQPIAAALEKPTLQSLRSFQHSDVDGNIIGEFFHVQSCGGLYSEPCLCTGP